MYCRNCGRKITKSDRCCPDCGTTNTHSPNSKKAVLAACISVLVLIAGIFAVFILGKGTVNVTFELGFMSENPAPDTQVINPGKCAIEPEDPQRDGFVFIGWYEAEAKGQRYDFSCPVKRNLKLTAGWMDPNDKKDSDRDGLADAVEIVIGSDPKKTDSDADGLSDYTEFMILGLNTLKKDTDNNGIPDNEEDSDKDGLANAEEMTIGTNPLLADTDRDGLSDFDEYKTYRTSPVSEDTDGDGANDRKEIIAGSDPLQAEMSFTMSSTSDGISETNPVSLSVSATTDSQGIGTLTVNPVTTTNIPALSKASYGYLGTAYELHTDGRLEKAVLTFEYDPDLAKGIDGFQPCVYYYNEETRELEELDSRIIADGRVIAEVEHFSIYTLMNKAAVDYARNASYVPISADTTDRNQDGIPDCYTDLINDGTILYDNTSLLTGVYDMYGADSNDWDGDGLLNGEEISVVMGSDGSARIQMISNPILVDSDFDGLSDFEEVYQLDTDPLKPDRRSVGAFRALMNDGQYSYTLHEKDWRDYFAQDCSLIFGYDKYEIAKGCLMDYFYDYAPEETLIKNAELIEKQTAFEEGLELYGTISNSVKILKDISSVLEDSVTVAELEDTYYESINLRKNMLNDINMQNKQGILYGKELSLLKLPEKLSKASEDLMSENANKQVDGITELIGAASTGMSLYKKATQIHVYSMAREFGDYTKSAEALTGKAKLPEVSDAFTVACDIVEAGEDLLEVRKTYAKLRANADAYNMFTELLLYIGQNAEDDYVARAAFDVAAIVLGNSDEYYAQLTISCVKEVAASAFKVALDEAAKTNAYAAIAKAFVSLYDLTGVGNQAKYTVYFDVMDEISMGCEALLRNEITEHEQTFTFDGCSYTWFEKYLVQLAQSRIIGEYYFHEYIADEGAIGKLAALLSGVQPTEYREMFRNTAERIYGYSNRLKLKLSPKLPYYAEFWNDTTAEDRVELKLTPEIVFKKAAGEYARSSGVGAWGDIFILNADGTFTGHYKDTDAGSSGERDGEAYDGTIYYLDYSGRFEVEEQIDDYRFRLKLKDFRIEGDPNADEIVADAGGYRIRYLATPEAGLDMSEGFTLCIPDTDYDEIGIMPPWQYGFGSEPDFTIVPDGNSDGLYYLRVIDTSFSSYNMAYLDFIEKQKFLNFGQDYGQDSPWIYSLCDMDLDGTPELIIDNGYEPRILRCAYIYSFYDGSVHYLDVAPSERFISNDKAYPGLFSRFDTFFWYYRKVGNEIVVTQVAEREQNFDGNWVWKTDDQELFRVFTEVVGKTYDLPEEASESVPSESTGQVEIKHMTGALRALSDAADYMYIDQDFNTGSVLGVYYLVPNEEKTEYECYSSDLTLYSTVPYESAKQLIDDTLGNLALNLPQKGGISTIIWESPYGLCAYQRNYRDYYSLKKVDAAGNSFEDPIDISRLPYILNESKVLEIYNGMNLPEALTIPKSLREE